MGESFKDQWVLVTGGATGIGKAIACAFADQGAVVTVTGLTDEQIDEFDSGGRNIAVTQLDVCNPESISSLVDEFDRLDILVNAAGTIGRDGIEFQPGEFDKVIDVNLSGTMRMCTACRPLLSSLGANGSILNIASMLTYFGSGFVPAYSASKGGIAQLTKSLAIAWAAEGIRVNALAPGWIKTPLTEPLFQDQQRSKPIIDRTPLGRWGEPEEVAGAALFLSSPQAGFITGAILPVDGGYSVA